MYLDLFELCLECVHDSKRRDPQGNGERCDVLTLYLNGNWIVFKCDDIGIESYWNGTPIVLEVYQFVLEWNYIVFELYLLCIGNVRQLYLNCMFYFLIDQ